MQVSKLSSRQVSKLKTRLVPPIDVSKTKHLQAYRKRLEAQKRYGHFKSAYSSYEKESQEYIDALNEINEEFGYYSHYDIQDNELVERQVKDYSGDEPFKLMTQDPKLLKKRYEGGYYKDYFEQNPRTKELVDKWYYNAVILKEESEFLESAKKAKARAKAYYGFVGTDKDLSDFDKSTKDLLSQKFKQKEIRAEFIKESKEKEKEFYLSEIKARETAFKEVLAKKPSPVMKSQEQYHSELNRWIKDNEQVLGQNYKKSMMVLEGNIQLKPKQKAEAEKILSEVESFKSTEYGLTSKSPTYWLRSSGGFWLRQPIMEGEYKVLDPKTFKVTEKKRDIKWEHVGFADWRPRFKGETTIKTYDLLNETKKPMIKEYVIQKMTQRGKWGQVHDVNAEIKSTMLDIAQSRQAKKLGVVSQTQALLSRGYKYKPHKTKPISVLVQPPLLSRMTKKSNPYKL